jgi:hypothetical protein
MNLDLGAIPGGISYLVEQLGLVLCEPGDIVLIVKRASVFEPDLIQCRDLHRPGQIGPRPVRAAERSPEVGGPTLIGV